MEIPSDPSTSAVAGERAFHRSPIHASGERSQIFIGERRSKRLDVAELWAYRELLFFFTWKDIKVRYKQTVIGLVWAVIQPVALMIVFTLIFGRLARIASNGIPYPVFFYSAIVPWSYFSQSVNHSTNTVVNNRTLITKVYFPRALLPLSSVLSPLVDFSVAFVILIGLMFYYGVVPGISALLVIPLLLLAIATAVGVGFWCSALNAVYRDVRYAVPILVQFWMFASPVVYPTSMIPRSWRTLYGVNPMAGVIEGFRWALTGRGDAPGPMILVSIAAVLVMLISGLWYFRRSESYVADVV